MTHNFFSLTTFLFRMLTCAGIFGVAVATLGLVGSSRSGSAALIDWQTKVDPWVLQTAAEGETEFLVMLKEQADLSQVDPLATKLEKGAYVYRQLTETANRTQGALLATLKEMAADSSSRLEYQEFWVVNAVWVRGEAETIRAIAERPDVAHLYANPEVKIDLPEQPDQTLTPDASEAVEWGAQKVRAPEVWAAGYTGQDVVIGGQDTGYDWDHVALKNHYRGWNGVSAEHNYSWHDAIHSGGGICGANSPVPCDDGYHGTHTMGTMVGDDGGSNQDRRGARGALDRLPEHESELRDANHLYGVLSMVHRPNRSEQPESPPRPGPGCDQQFVELSGLRRLHRPECIEDRGGERTGCRDRHSAFCRQRRHKLLFCIHTGSHL